MRRVEHELCWLQITDCVAQIYDALEKRQQDKLKRILERGRMVKDYHFILVMLLRLRQAANHTQLITVCSPFPALRLLLTHRVPRTQYAADEFGLNVNQATDDADNNNPEEELERATRLIGAPGVAKVCTRLVACCSLR